MEIKELNEKNAKHLVQKNPFKKMRFGNVTKTYSISNK
jgi:hypothetical protein